MERAADLRTRAGGSVDHFRRNLATTAMAAAARNAGWIADRSRRARREDGGSRRGAAFAGTDFERRIKPQRRCGCRVPDLVCNQASLRGGNDRPDRDGRDHIDDSRGGARIPESIRGYGTSAHFLAVLWSAAACRRFVLPRLSGAARCAYKPGAASRAL